MSFLDAVLGSSGYRATSATSLAIGTGSKGFTTQAALAYSVGARVRLSHAADPAKYIEGVCTAYDDETGAMTVLVDVVGGSGTYADWNVNIAGEPGEPAAVASRVSLAFGGIFAGVVGWLVWPQNNGTTGRYTNLVTPTDDWTVSFVDDVPALHYNGATRSFLLSAWGHILLDVGETSMNAPSVKVAVMNDDAQLISGPPACGTLFDFSDVEAETFYWWCPLIGLSRVCQVPHGAALWMSVFCDWDRGSGNTSFIVGGNPPPWRGSTEPDPRVLPNPCGFHLSLIGL